MNQEKDDALRAVLEAYDGLTREITPKLAAQCRRALDVIAEPETADEHGFDAFWKAYPRKVGKPTAFSRFRNQKCARVLPVLMAALDAMKNAPQWANPDFIPHPATWLSQRRWEDPAQQVGATNWNDIRAF